MIQKTTEKNKEKEKVKIEKNRKKIRKYRLKMAQLKQVIPAKNIKSISHGDGLIEEYVNEILDAANDKLEYAIENGLDTVILEMRTLFDIPRMKNADVQPRVYFWVLKSLEEAGYKVKIVFQGTKAESQKVFLIIKWFGKQDDKLKSYMDKYIKKHTVKAEKKAESGDRTPKKIVKKERD